MAKAVWNGVVLAESDRCESVEGVQYFPPDSIQRENFRVNDTKTTCHWKGEASYYDIVVGDQVNEGAAWYYPSAMDAAKHIEGYVAFWKDIEVEA